MIFGELPLTHAWMQRKPHPATVLRVAGILMTKCGRHGRMRANHKAESLLWWRIESHV
jgi:hypothetical protein